MNKKIEYLIIHCTGMPMGSLESIRREHVDVRGFRDIGYHYLILNGQLTSKIFNKALDGKMLEGRRHDGDDFIEPGEQGAHAPGFNQRSLSICLVGDKDFTTEQFQSMRSLCSRLMREHDIPLANVLGHCETASGKKQGKTCPNLDMNWVRAYIKS